MTVSELEHATQGSADWGGPSHEIEDVVLALIADWRMMRQLLEEEITLDHGTEKAVYVFDNLRLKP